MLAQQLPMHLQQQHPPRNVGRSLSNNTTGGLSVRQFASAAPYRPVNQATLELIKFSEGFVPMPAPDQVGMATVGYGHQCQQPRCSEISQWLPLTPFTAQKLLLLDIVPFSEALATYLRYPDRLNNNQWGALVSWAYNVGTESVRMSKLVKRINNGENPSMVVAAELPQWDYAGGQRLLGLTRRRAAELL
ncbi:hypothetical protein GGF49_005912, partial [Coemansia sp. RSA 1853]